MPVHPTRHPASHAPEITAKRYTQMLYGGKELASSFRVVRKNTIQVAEDIPEAQFSHVAAPGCKTVAQMLVHTVLAADIRQELHQRRRVTTFVGLDFAPVMERMLSEEAKPRTKAEILDLLRTQGEEFATWLENLTPEFLSETVAEPRRQDQQIPPGTYP